MKKDTSLRITEFSAKPRAYVGEASKKVLERVSRGSNNVVPKTGYHYVRETEFKNTHIVLDGAPDEWALKHGATHTLECRDLSTRPAILTKTRLFVMTDEDHEGPLWERWEVRDVA